MWAVRLSGTATRHTTIQKSHAEVRNRSPMSSTRRPPSTSTEVEQDQGLGTTAQPISEAEARRAAVENARPLTRHGTNQHREGGVDNINSITSGGTSAAYLISKIKRDRPDPSTQASPAARATLSSRNLPTGSVWWWRPVVYHAKSARTAHPP
jgi:hypothetical protein